MSINIEFDGKELSSVSASVCRLAIAGSKVHEVYGFVRLVLIPKQGGALGFLSGSNGSQTVTRPIHLNVDGLTEQRTILLLGSKLQQIATAYKDSGDKPIKLKIDKDNAQGVFSSGRSKMKLELGDAAAYPTLEKVGDDFVSVTLSLSTFMRELSKAKHAAAVNSPRAFCNGINLTFAQNTMSIVSTDGHRMFRSIMGDIEVKGSTHPSIILPTTAIDHILNAQDGTDSPLIIKFNNHMAEFNCASAQVRTTLIDFEYPNISNFFSGSKTLAGNVQRDELLQVLNRIRPITDDNSQLDVDFGQGELVIKAIDKTGKLMGEDALPCDVNDVGRKMRFSCRYLIDALTNVDGQAIDMNIDTERQFLMFNAKDNDKQTSIVMPMQR